MPGSQRQNRTSQPNATDCEHSESQIGELRFQIDGLEEIAPGKILQPIIPERSVHKDGSGAVAFITDYRTAAGRAMTEIYDQLTATIQNLAKEAAR